MTVGTEFVAYFPTSFTEKKIDDIEDIFDTLFNEEFGMNIPYDELSREFIAVVEGTAPIEPIFIFRKGGKYYGYEYRNERLYRNDQVEEPDQNILEGEWHQGFNPYNQPDDIPNGSSYTQNMIKAIIARIVAGGMKKTIIRRMTNAHPTIFNVDGMRGQLQRIVRKPPKNMKLVSKENWTVSLRSLYEPDKYDVGDLEEECWMLYV